MSSRARDMSTSEKTGSSERSEIGFMSVRYDDDDFKIESAQPVFDTFCEPVPELSFQSEHHQRVRLLKTVCVLVKVARRWCHHGATDLRHGRRGLSHGTLLVDYPRKCHSSLVFRVCCSWCNEWFNISLSLVSNRGQRNHQVQLLKQVTVANSLRMLHVSHCLMFDFVLTFLSLRFSPSTRFVGVSNVRLNSIASSAPKKLTKINISRMSLYLFHFVVTLNCCEIPQFIVVTILSLLIIVICSEHFFFHLNFSFPLS